MSLLDELRNEAAQKKAEQQAANPPAPEPAPVAPADAAKTIIDSIGDQVRTAFDAGEHVVNVMIVQDQIDFSRRKDHASLINPDCLKDGSVADRVAKWCAVEGYDVFIMLYGGRAWFTDDHKWTLFISGWYDEK